MRSRLFTILVAGFFLTPNLEAQVSLEMLPTEANSIITDVTLYRNRAAITRTATLELDAGGHSVFFRNLPSGAFLDSIQARVSDNASLLSVDTSNKPTLVENSSLVAKLVTEIDEVELKIAASNAQTEAIALQIQMLETLIEKAANDKAPPVDIEAFDTQITFIGTRMQELSTAKSINATEKQELRALLQNLKQKKQNVSSSSKNQIDTVVDVGVVKDCTVEIQLTYLVNNATWLPTYSIHANAQGNLITIGYEAELAQKTGENWTDVALTLSTAQPQQSITPPMPRPWFVDVFEPAPPAPILGVRLNTIEEESSVGFGRSGGDLSYAWAKNVASASANATVTGEGPAVSFVLPRTVTVPSNAVDKQKTSLGVIETSAKQYLIAVPMLTDNVFTRSEVTNKSDYILLPGRASIFHGSDYVGKTSLPTISPNESFSLDLGIDPSVNVTRTLVEKVTSSTGLFSSGKQTIYVYQIAISNGNDTPIEIRVFDRVPVSRNEEIEVLIKNLSAPLSTDVAYENSDRQQGILRWDITVPANRTGDQSFMLTWQVEIARGKEIELTPLPE